MNIASLLQALAGFAWIAVVGVLILIFTRVSRNQSAKGLSSLAIGLVIVAILMTAVGAGLVFVEPDQRGVVITIGKGGILPEALEPGIHWIIPFVQRVELYSIARATYTMAATAGEGQVAGDDSTATPLRRAKTQPEPEIAAARKKLRRSSERTPLLGA